MRGRAYRACEETPRAGATGWIRRAPSRVLSAPTGQRETVAWNRRRVAAVLPREHRRRAPGSARRKPLPRSPTRSRKEKATLRAVRMLGKSSLRKRHGLPKLADATEGLGSVQLAAERCRQTTRAATRGRVAAPAHMSKSAQSPCARVSLPFGGVRKRGARRRPVPNQRSGQSRLRAHAGTTPLRGEEPEATGDREAAYEGKRPRLEAGAGERHAADAAAAADAADADTAALAEVAAAVAVDVAAVTAEVIAAATVDV